LTGLEVKDPERLYHRLKFIRAKRPEDPKNTFQIANIYYSQRMEDEAIKEYRRCLKLDPNFLPAKWFLSHVLYSKGYYDEAFRLVREIIDRKPEAAELFYWAGEVLLKLDEIETAKEYFARCDELLAIQVPRKTQMHYKMKFNPSDFEIR